MLPRLPICFRAKRIREIRLPQCLGSLELAAAFFVARSEKCFSLSPLGTRFSLACTLISLTVYSRPCCSVFTQLTDHKHMGRPICDHTPSATRPSCTTALLSRESPALRHRRLDHHKLDDCDGVQRYGQRLQEPRAKVHHRPRLLWVGRVDKTRVRATERSRGLLDKRQSDQCPLPHHSGGEDTW